MVIIHNIERKCKLFSYLEKEVCFLGRNNEVCDDDMGFCVEKADFVMAYGSRFGQYSQTTSKCKK